MVSNVNMPVFVFEKKLNKEENNFIKFELEGLEKNKNAIGTKIYVKQVMKHIFKKYNQ